MNFPFKEYDRAVLPVINEHNILLGVVTVDDVMDVVEQRDTAAIQKFGGIEELDYPYVKTTVFFVAQKKSWLVNYTFFRRDAYGYCHGLF